MKLSDLLLGTIIINENIFYLFLKVVCIFVFLTGFGIFTDRPWHKGEFLMMYKGNLLPFNEAVKLERNYAVGGCYMYYFPYKGKKYW